ncbi:MAG: amidase [Candidatus Acidiferrales bacterium]
MEEITSLSAAEMAAGIREKKFSLTELVDAHLRRIEMLEPKLHAFATVDAERVRSAAQAATEAATNSKVMGPLQGVPVTIKSSIDVAGLRCAAGSRLRAEYVPGQDAPLVARLKAAGAIVLGNTNVPEMLMAYETNNLLNGRTNNPWDLARTPGGSSGGEAAAIAARCSAAGVGSDGGGSVRVPAHFSGICGHKPTPGRIPSTGHFPPSAGPFAHLGVVGPMARSVEDLKILFEVMAGPDTGDAAFAPVPVRWPKKGFERRTRIGYFEEDGRTPVTAETRAAVRKAAEALRARGFEVVEFRPEGLERARQLWWNLFVRAGALMLGPMLEGHEQEISPLLKEFRAIEAAGPRLTLGELMMTLIERDTLRTQFFAQMERYPILLCPVAAIPAFRHGEREWQVDGKRVEYLDAMSYTQWFNLLGNPGTVVPVGKSPEGLPIGVQVVGRLYEDEMALAVAEKIEAVCGRFAAPMI